MSEVTNLVKVGNAILSPKCLGTIEDLQADDNYVLNSEIEFIKDAIMLLALADFFDDKKIQMKRKTIEALANIIDGLECLEA